VVRTGGRRKRTCLTAGTSPPAYRCCSGSWRWRRTTWNRPRNGRAPGWLAIAAVTGAGTGIAAPASNNATLQLAPQKAASISGLRGMFRQAGRIIGLAIASSVVARSSNPGLTQAAMFIALAAFLVLLIPLTFLVPEHRGTW
jgi:MFS family permease